MHAVFVMCVAPPTHVGVSSLLSTSILMVHTLE